MINYSSSHIITIDKGVAKIQQGTFTIIHVIKIKEYEDFINNVQAFINQNIPKTHNKYPLLILELTQTTNILENLTPTTNNRQRRSIDAIGTVWKYIAGTPDHHDFQILANNIVDLNNNNNKQVFINEAFNKRLNNLTEVVKAMANQIRKDVYLEKEIVINLQNKIRLVKEELMNIEHAILWARLNIVNPNLLSKKEIKIAMKTLIEENINFSSPEEALEFSKVSIINNNKKEIFYLIKIPLTKHEIYKHMVIRPVKRNNKVIHLDFKEILTNKKEMFAIKEKCKNYNNVTICNEKDIIIITEIDCIPKLINNLNSSCILSNGHHIPLVEEIDSGIILLNDYNGSIIVNEEKYNISGTFLIKSHNTTIKVENRTFNNWQASPLQTMPAMMQLTPFEKGRINLLSLEALNELQINNTDIITTVKSRLIIGEITFSGISLVIIIVIIIAKIFSKRVQKITVWEPQVPKVEELVEMNKLPRITNITPEKPPRLHKIPLF